MYYIDCIILSGGANHPDVCRERVCIFMYVERERAIHTHMYASLQVHLFMCVNDSQFQGVA